LAGNGTVEAAKALGWDEITVAVAPKEWDADTAKAYALADNRSAELADWDYKVLQNQLIELDTSGWNIEALGFDIPEPTELPTEETDEIPELPADPITKPGDVWKLGDHIVICGDSTAPSTYEKLMGDNKAQIVVTDPPWNVNYGDQKEGNIQNYKPRQIMNDNLGPLFGEFCDGFVAQMKDNSAPGAMIYLVMSAQEWPVIHASLTTAGFHWSSTIIWAKDRLVLSRKDYHTQYEPIWYGWNDDGPRLSPLDDRKQSDLWQIDRPRVSELHPTTKPVELITRMLQNSSKPHDIVLEPFGGSGSTLIACEDTNRFCRAVELDPKYVDVIVKRWENHTGKKAELVTA
jgi:DNA modification methylase